MPTYDYSCQKCGQTFEAFQSMRDEPFRECPKDLCRLPKWGAAAKKESAPKASEGSDKSSKSEPAKTSSSGETKTAEKKSTKESA